MSKNTKKKLRGGLPPSLGLSLLSVLGLMQPVTWDLLVTNMLGIGLLGHTLGILPTRLALAGLVRDVRPEVGGKLALRRGRPG